MKKLLFIITTILILLPSCKRQDWLDWKAENEAWMATNLHTPYVYGDSTYTVKQTATGLQYVIISDPNPTDAKPSTNSYISCDYTGHLINGYNFDKGTLAGTAVAGLVAGFQEGIKKIHSNGDIVLFIPWNLGYGEKGSGTEGYASSHYIPPYSTLIFQIHLK